ncbi:MAG: hypothetical protein Q9168_004268 [Polycauliona sp. 1 TL-2023]
MKYSVSAVAFSSLAAHAAAQGCNVKFDTNNNAGNPITAPLNSIVPAGTPFTIMWTASEPKNFPVAIELLRGPSTNVVPIQCLTASTPNNGEFSWTPAPSLQADVTGYGLRIIVLKPDGTGSFQYSTQFGISNNAVKPITSSSAPTKPATTYIRPTSDASTIISSAESSSSVISSAESSSSVLSVIAPANTTTTTVPMVTGSSNSSSSIVIIGTTHVPIPVPSSGALPVTSVLQPSKNMTVPASLQSSKTQAPSGVTASGSATSVQTGTGSPIAPAGVPSDSGAGKMLAGSMLAALAAMGALLL